VFVRVDEKSLLERGLANLKIAYQGDKLVASGMGFDDFEA
jgi:hypothetical protein